MFKNRFLSSSYSWLTGLLLLFLVAAAGILVIRNWYLEPWLSRKIKAQVPLSTQGLYQVDFRNLDLSLTSGTLALDNLHLLPSEKVWHQLKQKQPAKSAAALLELKTRRLTISGIDFWRLYRGRAQNLSRIRLSHPDLVITQMEKAKTQKPVYQRLTGPLQNLRAGQVTLVQGRVRLKDAGEKWNQMELDGLNLEVKDLRLDSLSFRDRNRIMYADHLKMEAGAANFLLPLAYYRLRTARVYLDSKTGNLQLNQATLVPLASAGAMARRKGNAITRLQVKVPVLQASQINFAALVRNGAMQVGTIDISNPQVYAYMDLKNFPQKLSKPLVHEMVRKIKTPFNIRRINIRNLNLHYEELSARASKTGFITLKQVKLNLRNWTNDPRQMSARQPARAFGSGKLMGQALLQVSIRQNLLDKSGYHTIRGSIGRCNPRILNPLIEPAYYMRVKDGLVTRGNFEMTLTSRRATGSLHLSYEDFKIDLLTQTNPEKTRVEPGRKHQSLGKKLLSVFANKVVLNSNNLAQSGNFKVGKIDTPRRTNRSFFTFWVDGLTSGVRSTLGLPSEVPKPKKPKK